MPVRGVTAPVSWLRGVFPCFAHLPYFSRSEAEFLRVLCLSFCVESSRWGHPSGSSLSQSSIGTKSLPPPSWCLIGVFAMGSPCQVEFVSDLDRTEDSLRPFLSGWRQAFAMRTPVSSRVAFFLRPRSE